MKPNPNIGQGRNGDVPAREWNWGFIGVLAGGWLFVLLAASGCWYLGWRFGAGMGLMGLGMGVFGCWGLGKAAPW